MARALSDDLRIRVLKASAAGMSARQAANRFGVGISTAIRWIARAVEGEPTPRPQGLETTFPSGRSRGFCCRND